MKIYFIRDMHGMWYVEHSCVLVETKNDNRAKDYMYISCGNRKFDVKKQENCHKARTVKHTYIVTAKENWCGSELRKTWRKIESTEENYALKRDLHKTENCSA